MTHRLIVSLILLLLVGCTQAPTSPTTQTTPGTITQNTSPEATPVSDDPQPPASATAALDTVTSPAVGTASIAGKVVSNTDGEPIKQTVVALAKVFRDANDPSRAAFALDIANSPATYTDDSGNFTLTGVEPGEYVISVGDFYGLKDIVRETNGDARVYTLEADQPADAGTVEVRPDVTGG